jgi:carotenoid cleavage dioxygenase-like enzyme
MQDTKSKGKSESIPLGSTSKESIFVKTQAPEVENTFKRRYQTFLLGFQNCAEINEPVSLEVQGEIPNWITGQLIRNAPSVYTLPVDGGGHHEIKHWFDGLSFLHRFEVEKGTVRYSNRFIAKKAAEYVAKHGR